LAWPNFRPPPGLRFSTLARPPSCASSWQHHGAGSEAAAAGSGAMGDGRWVSAPLAVARNPSPWCCGWLLLLLLPASLLLALVASGEPCATTWSSFCHSNAPLSVGRSQGRRPPASAGAVGTVDGVLPASLEKSVVVRAPIYSFDGDVVARDAALAKFERIDDVIMGGVSKSKLVAGTSGVASWWGLVRTAGGGFCGQRTRTFQQPLNLSGYDGLVITCALVSDADADRRVWKLSLRLDETRGEVVYQAEFVPPVGDMQAVYVPFSSFQLVRGPIAILGAPSISNTSAIFQIGFTCSKFVIDSKMTQLEDFRNGTFQLDIAEIGAYAERPAVSSQVLIDDAPDAPEALTEAQAKGRQPLLVRAMLLPLLGLVFSEARRRRKRAAQLLRERGASRWQLAYAGWRFKRYLRGRGVLTSLLQSAAEVVGFVALGSLRLTARLLVFPAFRLAARRRERGGGSGSR